MHPETVMASTGPEPIRPYDLRVERGLYGLADAMHAVPGDEVVTSKSIGAFAVMFGGAAVAWRAWRHHTITTDISSGETLAASRLAGRLFYFRGVAQFLGVPQVDGSRLFTDNDGTWYVSKDATSDARARR